jgi:hypothetical protein
MIAELENILSTVKPYIISSPPRCASTTVARCLYNNSAIDSYIHEPCIEYYHNNKGIISIIENLKNREPKPLSTLIKDISFQIGTEDFRKVFFEHASSPIIFLLRNPKLSIESKIRRIFSDLINNNSLSDKEINLLNNALKSHDYKHTDRFITDTYLSPEQTGWSVLYKQVVYCLENDIKFVLFETDNMRATPKKALIKLCTSLNINFEDNMINWKNEPFPDHGILPEQKWFARISSSTTIQPPTEKAIPLNNFPEKLLKHVESDISIYQKLINHPNNLKF